VRASPMLDFAAHGVLPSPATGHIAGPDASVHQPVTSLAGIPSLSFASGETASALPPITSNALHAPEDRGSLVCALTGQTPVDPVRASDGQIYERSAVLALLAAGALSPVTRRPFPTNELNEVQAALRRKLAGRAPVDQFRVRELLLKRDRGAVSLHPQFDLQNIGEEC
jgi:hypothetical protein